MSKRTTQMKAYELACSYSSWQFAYQEGDNIVLARYEYIGDVRFLLETAHITPEGELVLHPKS